MVRNLFLYVLTAFTALSSPAFAGDKNCDDCDLYKHGVHRNVVPTNDYDCVWFVQPHRSNILLRLVFKDGTSRPYTKKNADREGFVCPGRTWLQQATSKSFICNDENHYDYAQPGMIEELATKPKMSHAGEACLFGRKLCAQMGYPAYGDNK